MRVDSFRSGNVGNRFRVSATVRWEDSDRPTREVFFETTPEFANDLTCDPHAFLLVTVLRAFHHGERRVAIDAEIVPELKNGLKAVMTLLRSWYGPNGVPITQIESDGRSGFSIPKRVERASSLFSGGVDSLATIRSNRIDFPSSHPWSIKDGFVIYGFDLGHQFPNWAEHYEENYEKQYGIFERRLVALREIAVDAGMDLIPVYTNTQVLSEDLGALQDKYHGADLSAIAYAFSRRVSMTSIGSSSTLDDPTPNGSHALIDGNYSSAYLRVLHAEPTLTREDKVRLIADWDVALQNLRVCNGHKEDPNSTLLNCGRCEKCLRTMTMLTLLGKLSDTSAFGTDEVTESMLANRLKISTSFAVHYWVDLIKALQDSGRQDLVRGVQAALRRYRRRRNPAFVRRLQEYADRRLRRVLSTARNS